MTEVFQPAVISTIITLFSIYFNIAVLEYAEHGDLFASWCCTPSRQVPLEITRLYSSEIALALGIFMLCVGTHACIERVHVYSCT